MLGSRLDRLDPIQTVAAKQLKDLVPNSDEDQTHFIVHRSYQHHSAISYNY